MKIMDKAGNIKKLTKDEMINILKQNTGSQAVAA